VVLAAVTAFVLGAAATVLVKQALALGLVGHGAAGSFLKHLRLWMSVPQPGRHVPGILQPYLGLLLQSSKLTFGSRPAGFAVIAATGAAWAVAAALGWRLRESAAGRDLLILLGSALVPAVWVLLLPNHTYVHAWLMVRLLVVPISLAPVALCWPRWSGRRR
jgi:hypothetical protein